MLSDARAVAFVGSNDLHRGRAFYEGVLGLTVQSEDDTVVVLHTAFSEIRLIHPGDYKPTTHAALGFEVADLIDVVESLREKGVICERFSDAQDVSGIARNASGEMIAWVKDPDGNVITLSQPVV